MWKESREQAEKKQMRILNPEVCTENWKRKQNSFHLDTKYLLNWSNSERIREILQMMEMHIDEVFSNFLDFLKYLEWLLFSY